MSTVLKKKIDLANVNDENKHIVITLQITTTHAVDHSVIDNLLKQLSSSSQVPLYKEYVKQPKEKKLSNKNKFNTGNTV